MLSGAGAIAQRTVGNAAIMRKVVPTRLPVAHASAIIQRDGEKGAAWRWKYGNKVGKEKRSSEKSREESEELLNQTPEQAAQVIFDMLRSKKSEMEKFERVAFALAGQQSSDIGPAYSALSGTLLNDDITNAFSNKYMVDYLVTMRHNNGEPTLRMMLYTALGKVTNAGFFTKSKLLSKLPRSKNFTDLLGDSKRFAELLERATAAERREVIADSKLMELLHSNKKSMWQALVAQADIDVAQEEKDAQGGNPPAPGATVAGGKLMGQRGVHSQLSKQDRERLAGAHEQELIDLLKGCIEKKFGFNKDKFAEGVATWRAKATPDDYARVIDPNGKFERAIKKELKLVPFVGANKGLDAFIRRQVGITTVVHLNEEQTLAMAKDQQLALYVKEAIGAGGMLFNAKKLYERALEWKSKATPADIAWVTKPDSEFRTALKKANLKIKSLKIALPYLGMNKDTEKFFVDLLTNPTNSQQENHVEAVKGNLERQGAYVDRGDGKARSPLGRLNRFMNDKRFPQLLNEMQLMSGEQRQALLDELDPASKTNALALLEEKVRRAGMDKEERARVKAMFTLDYGDPGGSYIDLWELVSPGKSTRAKAAVGHLKPSKLKKIGEVSSRQDIGKEIYKILLDLDDEEYLQIRQDKALIAKFKEYSEKTSYWEKILTLLGMKDENDQVASSGSLRKDQATAMSAGKLNPIRYAYMFDDAIEEKYTMTRYVEGKDGKLTKKHAGEGVGTGGAKGPLFVIASQAQETALQYEQMERGSAVGFMNSILLHLERINRNKALYIKERVKPVHEALVLNKPIPTSERIERARKEGFGVGILSKANRQRYYEAFQHEHGRQLLDDWSNVGEFIKMRATLTELDNEIVTLTAAVAQPLPDNPTAKQTEEHAEKQAALEAVLKTHASHLDRMRRFTIGIKQERRLEMKALRLNAEDRIKLEGMVSDKIIAAVNEDAEVQKYLDEVGLPYDEYMQQKVKAVDSLEMQRHLDTTRQWTMFATKSAQLKEGTRNVKGAITSTENRQRKVEKDGALTPQQQMEQLREIRDKGAKKTEKTLDDREMLEARFRDMQKSFEARAKAIFKLIAFAIVTGLTAGIGAPLSIGVHIAMEAGLQMLETAYDFFVLKKNTFQDVAVNFMMGVLQRTVNILTANLGTALNQSIFHPDMLGPGGAWVDRSISRSIAGLMNSVVMFAPKHVVAAYQQRKELEKVIKEGEDTIGDAATAMLKSQTMSIGKMFLMEIAKEGIGVAQGKEDKPLPPPEDFGTRMNERLAGGSTTDEQNKMWGRFEKKKQKDAKKSMAKAFFLPPKGKLEKDVAKGQLKDTRKEQRGKGPKDPIFSAIKDKLEANLATAHKASDKAQFKTIMGQLGIDLTQVAALTDEQKGEFEELCHIAPGKLEEYLA